MQAIDKVNGVEVALNESRGNLKQAMIVGWDKDGEFYFKTDIHDLREMLWLLELAKIEVLSDEDDD